MQNENGTMVDLYIPRKCSATNRLIAAKEHGSVQIAVALVDSDGKMDLGNQKTFVISGAMRKRGESDACLNRLFHEEGMLTFAE